MSAEARFIGLLIAFILACIETVRTKSYGWAAFAVVLGMQAYDVFQISLDN